MAGLTNTIAAFVAQPGLAIPAEAARTIRSGFIDTIATMLAARDEPITHLMRGHVRAKRSGLAESSLLLANEYAGASDAALVNGAAGHALDYDDVSLSGHPSTVLVPAVLAEGEAIGASGLDVMRAYLVGFEVWAELIRRDPDSHHTKGWHPTGVFGTVAAGAAVAHLRRLNHEQASTALAISASMSAGLIANFGTMTKPFHAGRAAANGIEAVRLAMAGMTAAPDAFEHQNGFLWALSPRGNVDRVRPATIGKELAILDLGLSIKKYPTCYATHRVIDGVLDVVTKNNVRPQDVDMVEATVGTAQSGMLRNHAPVTGLEAKFSLEFAVASSVVARKVGLTELTDQFVNQPDVRDAMTKVDIKTVETRCPIDPGFALTDRIVVRLKDGRKLDSGDIRFARGNAKLPLREEDLHVKFMDCARGVTHLDPGALFDRLAQLESTTSVKDLVGLRESRRAA